MSHVHVATPRHNSRGWLFHDALAIAARDVRHWRLQPGAILLTWLFPVMIALMFGGLFGGAISVPAGSTYFAFVMPGMFTLTMLFGMDTTALAVATDSARGVVDRFRSLPISSGAVILGRCLADMLSAAIGLIILVITALLLGWRWHNGVGAALAGFGLLLWLRFALLWIGIYIGLGKSSPEAVTPVQLLGWPIGFVSNIYVDPATMPGWLATIAAWNPLSATTGAARQLFGNPVFASTAASLAEQYAMLLACFWPLLITAVFAPLAARRFRQLGDR